ncbi:MAG TPA: YsnF/AvaK domain-containing protein, partial [Pyrinomonadaceae bacterium]
MENKSAEEKVLGKSRDAIEIDDSATIIPVIQEEIVVDKYIVEKGKVRVSKRISQHEEIIDEPLFHEEVKVERVPVNKIIDASPSVRQEGDTLIIPIVEEQVFVQKRLVLVEELRVRKEVIETHQPLKVTLLKEQVEVNRVAENKEIGREH